MREEGNLQKTRKEKNSPLWNYLAEDAGIIQTLDRPWSRPAIMAAAWWSNWLVEGTENGQRRFALDFAVHPSFP